MEFPDHDVVASLLDAQPLPGFVRVRHTPATSALSEPTTRVREELARLDFDSLSPGASVAVGVGSRGIHRIDEYVTAVVAELDRRGFEPVVVPAMGSHGGATAEGQRETLASLGVTESRVGAPVDARMDVERVAEVTVGDTAFSVFLSSAALAADALLVVNRVKPHTNFSGRVESGLCKMLVAGLGKRRGASSFHATALSEGYVPALEAAFGAIADAAPLVGGIALVENADEETSHVEAVPGSEILDREPALLERAYEEMATLPVEDIDLLVVDELGKDVSGAGMDTNVIGRYRVLNAPDPDSPRIKLIYARGLTDRTEGNGNGIGLADLTRRAAVDQLDLKKTYANALTSGSLAKSKLPVVAPDDELALRTALSALGSPDPDSVRVVWIRNTQELGELYVSSGVVSDLPDTTTVEGEVTLAFDDGTARFEPS
ncbi:DUF362 domain-containing protein [Salinigranum rubrum]|uniref:DUF362 domain-containing protein n=1 Tax=Salinigranum rubrum TaxID=755307 RepID=A0A2I8VLW7_9EURY|nr:DUF362 domain-containing protein [Salinigranum rubrum]AUV82874.1 DUF362 domain-containing protein [Salinigranum rubrum]